MYFFLTFPDRLKWRIFRLRSGTNTRKNFFFSLPVGGNMGHVALYSKHRGNEKNGSKKERNLVFLAIAWLNRYVRKWQTCINVLIMASRGLVEKLHEHASLYMRLSIKAQRCKMKQKSWCITQNSKEPKAIYTWAKRIKWTLKETTLPTWSPHP